MNRRVPCLLEFGRVLVDGQGQDHLQGHAFVLIQRQANLQRLHVVQSSRQAAACTQLWAFMPAKVLWLA